MSVWTDEKVEELKKLWDQGLSASAIGAALGVPRNAVLGKTHRLGWKRKEAADDQPKTQKVSTPRAPRQLSGERKQIRPRQVPEGQIGGEPPLPLRVQAPVAPIVQQVEEEPAWDNNGEPAVMQLRAASCRFPIGDPLAPNFRFCCRQTDTVSPYCPEHTALAYVPNQKRASKAA